MPPEHRWGEGKNSKKGEDGAYLSGPRQRSLILQPSAARRRKVSQLLTCGQFHCFTSRDTISDYVSVSLSQISTEGEKLTLSQLVVLPQRGTDGERVGVTEPQECRGSLCGHLIVAETIVRQGAVYSKCVWLLYPFTLAQSVKKMFLYFNAGTLCTWQSCDLTFSCPLFPLCVSVSAFRFATTQTALTWIAKAPFTCVSHVTHAAIQRTQTTCTLTGTPDLTYNLKVDLLLYFFIWYSPPPVMSYPLPHYRMSLCNYQGHWDELLST